MVDMQMLALFITDLQEKVFASFAFLETTVSEAQKCPKPTPKFSEGELCGPLLKQLCMSPPTCLHIEQRGIPIINPSHLQIQKCTL